MLHSDQLQIRWSRLDPGKVSSQDQQNEDGFEHELFPLYIHDFLYILFAVVEFSLLCNSKAL